MEDRKPDGVHGDTGRLDETAIRAELAEALRLYSENPCDETRLGYRQKLDEFAALVRSRKAKN